MYGEVLMKEGSFKDKESFTKKSNKALFDPY